MVLKGRVLMHGSLSKESRVVPMVQLLDRNKVGVTPRLSGRYDGLTTKRYRVFFSHTCTYICVNGPVHDCMGGEGTWGRRPSPTSVKVGIVLVTAPPLERAHPSIALERANPSIAWERGIA